MQVLAFKERAGALKQELENERQRCCKVGGVVGGGRHRCRLRTGKFEAAIEGQRYTGPLCNIHNAVPHASYWHCPGPAAIVPCPGGGRHLPTPTVVFTSLLCPTTLNLVSVQAKEAAESLYNERMKMELQAQVGGAAARLQQVACQAGSWWSCFVAGQVGGDKEEESRALQERGVILPGSYPAAPLSQSLLVGLALPVPQPPPPYLPLSCWHRHSSMSAAFRSWKCTHSAAMPAVVGSKLCIEAAAPGCPVAQAASEKAAWCASVMSPVPSHKQRSSSSPKAEKGGSLAVRHHNPHRRLRLLPSCSACLPACPAAGAALFAAPSPSLLRNGGSVLDYIPRAEHLRLLEARLAAKESDMQLQLNSRVAQASWRD